ncbi:CHAT domain-containing protein [Mycena epipterygia]|nr:CHAT domain-containing protein [Mycena epipterygia]
MADPSDSTSRDALESDLEQQASDLVDLADEIVEECKSVANFADLNTAIYLLCHAIHSGLLSKLQMHDCLDHLVMIFLTRFSYTESLEDVEKAMAIRYIGFTENQDALDTAIFLHREAISLLPVANPKRWIPLFALSNALLIRYRLSGNTNELEESILILRQLSLLRPNLITCLCAALILGKEGLKTNTSNILEAFPLFEEAMNSDHEALHSSQAGSNLLCWFQQYGGQGILETAASRLQAAESRLSRGHPGRCGILNNLAIALELHFANKRAIGLYREALSLRPAPNSSRDAALNNLANSMLEQWPMAPPPSGPPLSVRLRPPYDLTSPPGLVRCNNGLHKAVNCLTSMLPSDCTVKLWIYAATGNQADLENAIELQQEALALIPVAHPDRAAFLTHLATSLDERFTLKGDLADLEMIVDLRRAALDAVPGSHPHRCDCMCNLANSLRSRFSQMRDQVDLEGAIELYREAIAVTPAEHPDRGGFMNGLANCLHERFADMADNRDLEAAIDLHHQALSLLPSPHPQRHSVLNNLGGCLVQRFMKHRDITDLDSAIELHIEAVGMVLSGDSNRVGFLNNVANDLSIRFDATANIADLDKAIDLYREVLSETTPPHTNHGFYLFNCAVQLMHRYKCAPEPRIVDEAVDLFRESSAYISSFFSLRLNTAERWARYAEDSGHDSTLEAYSTAIELLLQIAMFDLDIKARQKALTSYNRGVVLDAAAAAIKLGKFGRAVEFLEEGRTIFWTQALQLRTPMDDLGMADPELAQKVSDLAMKLEQGSHCEPSSNRELPAYFPEHKLIDAEARRYRQLNSEWLQALQDVRQVPGSADFLRPKSMEVLRATEDVQCVPLLDFTPISASVMIKLLHGRDTSAWEISELQSNWTGSEKLSASEVRLLGQIEDSPNMSSDELFELLLAQLWNSVASPVFHALDLKKSADPPRLWWCPTGLLSFLPIHAAGLYGARGSDCAEAELRRIKTRVPGNWLTSLSDTSTVTVDKALFHLRQSLVVHFACHGTQDVNNPLDTGLELAEGRLKVSEIMRTTSPGLHSGLSESTRTHMSLAFLSACETTRGDENLPDEAIHLAATLLFAGYGGVVATMWIMDDRDGPRIADTFYENLFRNCSEVSDPPVFPDLTGAARALHLAVAKLREDPGISFKRWVPFVHYGM